jgi:hypothetical protein
MKHIKSVTKNSGAVTDFKIVPVLSTDINKSMRFYEERMGFKYLPEDRRLLREDVHVVLISRWAEFIIILKKIQIKLISEVLNNRVFEVKFMDVEEYSQAVTLLNIESIEVSYESPRIMDPGVPAFIAFEDADKNIWQYTFCPNE